MGFEVRDIGINVARDEFIRQVQEFKPNILALSALLTTTMPEMRDVIDALNRAGLRNSLKIMVGGAPVNDKFANEIGADGYGTGTRARRLRWPAPCWRLKPFLFVFKLSLVQVRIEFGSTAPAFFFGAEHAGLKAFFSWEYYTGNRLNRSHKKRIRKSDPDRGFGIA